MAKKESAFMKPWNISSDLAAVVGKGPMPRPEVTKQLWVYIKKNGLQDPKKGRTILPDANLKKIFDGKSSLDMMEMGKYISKHLS